MKKIYSWVAIFVIAIFGMVYWGMKSAPKIEAPTKAVYYYGRECPHCVNVQKFLDENKIDEKVPFSKKEVWHDARNAEELGKKAEECGLEKNEVGVPFLYAEGKCFLGEIEVENFFKKAAGISK